MGHSYTNVPSLEQKIQLKPVLDKCLMDYGIVQTLLLHNQGRVIVNELTKDLLALAANTQATKYVIFNVNIENKNLHHPHVIPSPTNVFVNNMYNNIY